MTKLSVAILAVLGSIAASAHAQNIPTSLASAGSGSLFIVNGTWQQPRPPGAVYHQVVDRYFDAEGKPIETSSATHRIDPNCHPGRREQQPEIIAKDDGRGNVAFTSPEKTIAEVR